MAVTLNHTGFIVNDLDSAIEFYRDALGLDLERTADSSSPGLSSIVGYDNARLRAAFLVGADGHTLELIQYINPPGAARSSEELRERAIVGAAHLAFLVENVDAVYERLLAAGGHELNPPVVPRPGVKACYLQDPDGNWIEIMQHDVHNASPFRIRQNTG